MNAVTPQSDRLTVSGVSKRFGATTALDAVSLRAQPGEVLTLLGPNGAGKTTLVEIMTGLRRADSGKALMDGIPVHLPEARRNIGLTPQRLDFPGTLTVADILTLVAAHFPNALSISETADRFLLTDLLDRRAAAMSAGQMRRVALAAAFIGVAGNLFLDEPTVGLDLESRRRCWDAVRAEAKAGALVIMTTHDLEEAARLSDRVAVIAGGRIVLDETPDSVRRRLGRVQIRFEADGDQAPLAGATFEEGRWVVDVADGDAAVRELVHSRIAFRNLEVGMASLESALAALLEEVRS